VVLVNFNKVSNFHPI